MGNTYGHKVVAALTNKSGGSVAAGDVVIIDTANNEAFTTTTSGGYTGGVGVAQETIANNATGRVLLSGYAALVNVNASVTRGNFGKTHTVAKQATDAGASRTVGTFCQFLTGGTTPTARVYPVDLNASSGSVATDAIFDAKGDLPAGTGADTAAKLTVGSNGDHLVANSAQSTGLQWVGGTVDATLSGDVTMTSANTAYDGPSASFAAGTWLIGFQAGAYPSSSTGQTQDLTIRLWDGTTTYGEASQSFPANTSSATLALSCAGFAIVTLGSTTTLKLTAYSIRAGGTLKREVADNSATSHTATRLVGYRLY